MKTSLISVIASLNKSLLLFAPLLPAIIPVLIDLWVTNIDQKSVRPQNWKIEYDFIIVGAGTAGSLIASELTRNNYKILLLEAGGNQNFFSDIPALNHISQQTSMDWQYVTEPQDNACLGLVDRRSRWPRGRVTGGTSALDDMIYLNGNPEDFKEWERMGVKGWPWDEIRSDFPVNERKPSPKQSIEDFKEGLQKRIEDKLTVQSYETSLNKQLLRAFIQSGRKLDYNFIQYNTKSELGFSYPLLSIRKGRRHSSAKLLDFVQKRKNLDVVNYAFVEKIIIENMTATAVQFKRFGYSYTIKAKREVILSAGAINSPQILILSGIGPKQHLESLNIPVIKDLPVGRNLQDQYGTQLSFIVRQNPVLNVHKDMNLMQFFKYILFSEGMLSTAPVESVAFITTENKSESLAPNLQLILKPLSFTSDNGLLMKKLIGIEDNFWKYFSKHENKEMFSIVLNLLHPKSRGSIELRSTNPTVAPKIDPKYYSSKEDMKTIIEGLKFVEKLIETKAFQSLSVESLGKPKQCKEYELKSDKFFECFARHLTLTANSAIGTCRMGEPSFPDSVVDQELQVIGIKGLRVADASVMPSQVSGGPLATIQMIGQKVANFIIESDLQSFRKKFTQFEDLVDNGFQMVYKSFNKYYGL